MYGQVDRTGTATDNYASGAGLPASLLSPPRKIGLLDTCRPPFFFYRGFGQASLLAQADNPQSL
jgi:hypothetical protein